tara:strand:- start:1625 stop:2671 length:1047 start_codon:yes stop_codon:yes gene_type:complete
MGIFDFLKRNKNIKTKNGLNLIYFNSGKGALMKRFYEKNGKKDGVYLSYYENGQLDEEFNWQDGEKLFEAKKYYENGQLHYKYDGLGESRSRKSYFESGELKSVSLYGKSSISKLYYKNGQLEYESKDMRPRKDSVEKKGFAKSYYESGELKSVTNFIGGEEIGLSKCYYKNGELEKEVPYIETLKKSNSGPVIRFNPKPPKSILNNPMMINNITQQNVKNGVQEYKHQINQFINKMKKIPDWYEIIQARGNGHAMTEKSMNIKVNDYEYWANAHKEEYLLKFNDGNLDIDGIKLRIEKFKFIVVELEKIIKKAAELKFNITHEMHNDYCAARASVLGAEYALKEMTE